VPIRVIPVVKIRRPQLESCFLASSGDWRRRQWSVGILEATTVRLSDIRLSPRPRPGPVLAEKLHSEWKRKEGEKKKKGRRGKREAA